jgi:hypothetical protein
MSEKKTFTHELTVTVRVIAENDDVAHRQASLALQSISGDILVGDYKCSLDTEKSSTIFELKRIPAEEVNPHDGNFLDIERLGNGKAIVKTRNSSYTIRKYDCGGYGVCGGVLDKEEIYNRPPFIVDLNAPMFFGEYRTSRVESVTYAPLVIDATEPESKSEQEATA